MNKQKKGAFLSDGTRRMFGVCIIMILAITVSACTCSCLKKKEPSSSSETVTSQESPVVEAEAPQSQTAVASEALIPVAEAAVEKSDQAQASLPRLLDLGADKCIPCKMMAPLLEELKEEYAGKLQVDFIDVWKNPEAARQYGVRVIPTQIFYDVDGNELQRHQGFIAKEDILAVFKKKGIEISSK